MAHAFEHILPEPVHDDDESYLQACEAALTERQERLRDELASQLNAALENGDTESSLAALDAVATLRTSDADDCAAVFEHQVATSARLLARTRRETEAAQQQQRKDAARAGWAQVQSEFNAAVEQSQFQDASYHLQQLRKELEDSDSDLSDTELAEELRAIVEHLRGTLEQVINSTTWESYLIFQYEALDWSLPLAWAYAGLPEAHLWDSADRTGCLPGMLAGLEHAVMQQVVEPVLSPDAHVELYIASYVDENSRVEYRTLVATGTEDGTPSQAPQKLATMLQLLAFLQDAVFGDATDALHRFMESFWPSCSQRCMAVIGSSDQDASAIERCLQVAKQLELELASRGCFQAGGSASLALSRCMATQEAVLLHQKQGVAVVRIRDLCAGAATWDDTSPDDVCVVPDTLTSSRAGHHKGPAVKSVSRQNLQNLQDLGWTSDSVLYEGSCIVWTAATRLLSVLEKDIGRAADPGFTDLQAAAICKTLEDFTALYSILVVNGGHPFSSSRRALVHINTARHLADAVTLLPLTLPAAAPARARIAGAALAAATALAETADALTSQLLQKQAAKVRKALSALPELRRFGDAGTVLAARKAVHRAALAVRSVSDSAATVAAPRLHALCFSSALGSLCAYLESKVLELKDIPEADSREIPIILEELWDNTPRAAAVHFVRWQDAGKTGKGVSKGSGLQGWTEDAVAAMLTGMCAPAQRLRMLGRLLTESLLDIVRGWEDGSLQGAGFSATQVVKIISSVFEDTNFRKQSLQRIQGM